ncbi:transcription initiation factor IIB [Candidatus Thorarchaeota archaeon]|nr:MAG: transcription initiation factor IIB [Candidatus Thorarchaeota archaeon]
MVGTDHIEDEILIDTHIMIGPEDAGGKVVITSSGIREKKDSKRYSDSKPKICSECGARTTVKISRTGDIVCTKCGLVMSERQIDPRAEWRAFTHDERNSRSRVGGPTQYSYTDKGLSTVIGWDSKYSTSKKYSPERRAAIARMRKWQIRSRVHGSRYRNISQAMTEIARLSSQMGLKKSVKELAATLYRKLIMKRLVRSRSIDALSAAAIYAALRLRKLPRSLKEIAKHTHLDSRVIGKYYRLLVRKLHLRMPVPDSMNYVPKLIIDLDLPGEMQEKVLEILQKAKDHNGLTTGRDPRGLAAGALYIASILTDNRITQREISFAAGVTEVTVRNRYKELVRELQIQSL